ncbi:DUF4388 domain-containing protein [Acanthopleuribacter pedis]|uniref:Response regulator n=1 Tax=Acanthopleuribacter pedis TaxID=442870 RepID=A0A8J7U5T8_9BACT|nr:DUF4388 domain-containing protein [Acanthopleuribacter pedis]MBO1320818.1 response regulator [Acanthopleuribacter pedis]
MKSCVAIEADAQIRAILQDHLETEGYRVRTFGHIEEFLQTAAVQPVDIILTGLLFDDQACWSQLERLVKEPVLQWVPVVVVSALRGSRFRTRAYRLNVRDYIEKPFDFSELSARIAAILDTPRAERRGLSGSLRTCPFTEIAQIVRESRKSGVLQVWQGERGGTVTFEGGQLTSATFAGSSAETALEHMIGLGDGGFVFETRAENPNKPDQGPGLDLQRVVMETAWLEDEWNIRRHQLPHPDARLRPPAGATDLPEPCQNPTTEQILALLRRRPGLTLAEITSLGEETPLRRRWAVTLLLEHELIKVDPPPGRHAVEALPITQSTGV